MCRVNDYGEILLPISDRAFTSSISGQMAANTKSVLFQKRQHQRHNHSERTMNSIYSNTN